MKKLLLFFFILFSCKAAQAQSWVYHPFPSDSVVWLQEQSFGWGPSSFSFFINELMGDTLIEGTQYKRLYQSNYWSTTPYTPSTPLYSPSLPVNYVGAWRQDIPGKKVYLISPGDSLEHLYHNFDLQVGDTVAANPFGDTIWVSDIDSALVGGFYHKMFIFSNTYCGLHDICPTPLIEGVGYYDGLQQRYIDNYSGWGQQLLCFSHQNITLYPSPTVHACSLTLGISDITEGKINLTVIPNPSKGIISLTVGCNENYTIEVQNSIGQTLMSNSNFVLEKSSIDLTDYPQGIYFIRVFDSKGNAATKKIVKQ